MQTEDKPDFLATKAKKSLFPPCRLRIFKHLSHAILRCAMRNGEGNMHFRLLQLLTPGGAGEGG